MNINILLLLNTSFTNIVSYSPGARGFPSVFSIYMYCDDVVMNFDPMNTNIKGGYLPEWSEKRYKHIIV